MGMTGSGLYPLVQCITLPSQGWGCGPYMCTWRTADLISDSTTATYPNCVSGNYSKLLCAFYILTLQMSGLLCRALWCLRCWAEYQVSNQGVGVTFSVVVLLLLSISQSTSGLSLPHWNFLRHMRLCFSFPTSTLLTNPVIFFRCKNEFKVAALGKGCSLVNLMICGCCH